MSTETLEDIFGIQPTGPDKGRQLSQGTLKSLGGSVLAIALGALLCWLIVSSLQPDDKKQDDKKQDKQEQVEPTPAASTGYLLFIHERTQLSAEQKDMLETAEAYCAEHKGLSYRSLDDDDPNPKVQEAVAFAKGKGLEPPCLVYKDAENKHRQAVGYPKTLPEMLKVLK